MKLCIAVILVLVYGVLARAEPVEAVRGLAQHVDVEYSAKLRARADQGLLSPVRVRVSPLGEAGRSQRVEFIGAVAGKFDLRDFLERDDGRPLIELPPLPVTVVSKLPADPGTDLYSSDPSWFNWRAHYRSLMWSSVAIWAAVPVVYLALRWLRHGAPPAAPAMAPPSPSIEEQLIAAIQASGDVEPTVEERARLELLLYRYFAENVAVTSNVAEDRAAAMRAVREHREARDLVAALDQWLHARGGGEIGRREAIAALEHLKRSRLVGSRVAAGVGP